MRGRRQPRTTRLSLGSHPWNLHSDSPQILGANNIESLAVRIAKGQMRKSDSLRSWNLAQAPAVRGEDPKAARGRCIEVSFAVHLYAIGAAEPLLAGQINKYLAILDRVIRLNAISKNLSPCRRVRNV